MEESRGYRKLKVYQKAHSLAVRVHQVTLGLPRTETYEEGSQVRRSSKSVPANIVEGYALRRYKPEFCHYLWRAHASAEETVEHLALLKETGSLPDIALVDELLKEYRGLAAMLYRFLDSLSRQHDPSLVGNLGKPRTS